jgi:hypothetical protein
MAAAGDFCSGRLTPVEEAPRSRRYVGVLGELVIRAEAEGGHYTVVTLETNQPGESELDRLARQFLSQVHVLADHTHVIRGAY